MNSSTFRSPVSWGRGMTCPFGWRRDGLGEQDFGVVEVFPVIGCGFAGGRGGFRRPRVVVLGNWGETETRGVAIGSCPWECIMNDSDRPKSEPPLAPTVSRLEIDPVGEALHPVGKADDWEMPSERGLWGKVRWQWRQQGWVVRVSLVAVLLGLLGFGYVMWRGDRDLAPVKAWRARQLVGQASADLARGDVPGAEQKNLEAVRLAPGEPLVLRQSIELAERRGDLRVLDLLRRLILTGQALPADRERLCRLALDWGQPGQVDRSVLEEWMAAPEDSLPLERLRLTALWLIHRGEVDLGLARLRLALARAENSPEAPRLETALASVMLSSQRETSVREAMVQEPLSRLFNVVYTEGNPLELRRQAAETLAGYLLVPWRRELLTPVRSDLLHGAFMTLAGLFSSSDPAVARRCELTAVAVDLTRHPERQEELLQEIRTKAATAPPAVRLVSAQWLQQNGFHQPALDLCDLPPRDRASSEWLTVRLEALISLGHVTTASQQLETWTGPLPPLFAPFIQYRIERALGSSAERVAVRVAALTRACARAASEEVLSTADSMEKLGDPVSAMALYTTLKNHPQAGLLARLGLVRCLQSQPERTAEFIAALNEMLLLRPLSGQARSDLAYLRLLINQPTNEDMTFASNLHRQSPEVPSARVLAALAQFRLNKAAEALALLEKAPLDWAQVPSSWRVVQAIVLAANDRLTEAKAVAARLEALPLRPEERLLLTAIARAP